MEGNNNIYRSWHNFQSETDAEKSYNFDLSNDKMDDIFLCHISECDPAHLITKNSDIRINSSTDHNYTDPRTGKDIINFIINCTQKEEMALFNEFPMKSQMNSLQHNACLRAIKQIKKEVAFSKENKTDLEVYFNSYLQREQERKLFLNFVKTNFYTNIIQRCRNPIPGHEFVLNKWKDSIKRAISMNTLNYQLQTALPLNIRSDAEPKIKLNFHKLVKQEGLVPSFCKDRLKPRLSKSCEFLQNSFGYKEKLPSHQAEKLGIANDADFTIPLNVFIHLLTNPVEVTDSKNILFSVKQFEDQCLQKIIIFEKPLPRQYLNCLRKNERVYKYSLKASVCIPGSKSTYCLDHGFSVSDMEQIVNVKKKSEIKSTELENKCNIYKIYDYNEFLNLDKIKALNNPNIIENSLHNRNEIYNMWELKNDSSIGEDPIKILVCSKLDCCELEGNDEYSFINLSAKVEYQSEFGAEQMSKTELITEWCKLRFNPGTFIKRVRIDAETGIVISVKQVSLNDVEMDLRRLYQLDISTMLQKLWNILKIVKQFPPNKYFIYHNKCDSAMVYTKSDDENKSNTINIKKLYEQVQFEESSLDVIEWNPIDDMEITLIHQQAKVMPCAFPHWGKKKRMQINDRDTIVQQADEKLILKKQRIVNLKKVAKRKFTKLKHEQI